MELDALHEYGVRLGRREAILAIGQIIRASGHDLGADAFPLVHSFSDGEYRREITIPADMIVEGRIHRHAHVNILSKGRALVLTEFEGWVELVAPCTWTSKAGTKRIVHALEEVVWMTKHTTDKLTVEEAVREIAVDTYEELEK